MDEITLNLIKNTMKSRYLSQQALCQGICSSYTISQYLNNEQEPDRLTFHALIQRLGIASDIFTCVISAKDYAYFQWRLNLLQELNFSNWQQAQELFHSSPSTKMNPVLQKQFSHIVLGILSAELEHDEDKAINCFLQALQLTCPNYTENLDFSFSLMSNQEWSALLNLLCIKSFQNPQSASLILQNIVYQLEKQPLSEAEQAKIYPYAIYLLVRCYFKEGRYATCEKLCQKAISILCENCNWGNLPQLISYFINCQKRLSSTVSTKLEEQLDVLNDIEKNYPVPNSKWLLTPLMESGQEILIYGNLIAQTRKARNMSQRQLCKDICSLQTLRNIESGMTTSGIPVIFALFERLQIPKTFFRTEIITEDFRTFELFRKVKQLSSHNDDIELEGYLKDLGNVLNQTSFIQNREWMTLFQGMIDYRNERIPVQDYLLYIQNTLKMSFPNFSYRQLSDYHLNTPEILLILQIAIIYNDAKKFDDAIEILNQLLTYYDKQGILSKFQNQHLIVIKYNFISYYLKRKDYNKVLYLSDSAIKEQLSCNRTLFIPEFFLAIAHSYKNLSPTLASLDKAKILYKHSALLGELIHELDVVEIANNMYQKL